VNAKRLIRLDPEHILPTVEDTERPNLAQWSYPCAGKLWGSAEELKRTTKFIGDIGLDV
jgi:hypothetical protein